MNIIIWSIISTILSLLLLLFIKDIDKNINLKTKIFTILISLSLCPVVNIYIKRPIFYFIENFFNISNELKNAPFIYIIIIPIIVSITEETIKIFPIIFKIINKYRNEKNSFFSLGFIVGLGFGIGEIWYLAFNFIEYSKKYSFFELSGFGSERLFATFLHGFMTSLLFYGISINKGLNYFLFVIFIHTIIDLPPAFYQAGYLPIYATYLFIVIFLFIIIKPYHKIIEHLRNESLEINEEKIFFKR